jgi:hypothetical protein
MRGVGTTVVSVQIDWICLIAGARGSRFTPLQYGERYGQANVTVRRMLGGIVNREFARCRAGTPYAAAEGKS